MLFYRNAWGRRPPRMDLFSCANADSLHRRLRLRDRVFPDFGDGPDDFRQENTVIEQFGDLPDARQVTKAEMTVSLVQQTELRISRTNPGDILPRAASCSAE
jgi:hypothetical protein